MTTVSPEELKKLNLLVTRGGVPFEDQAEGIKQFKDACRRWNITVDYMEICQLLSWHWKAMEEAAARLSFDNAAFHKRRHEELHAVLAPPGDKDSPAQREAK